MGCYCPKGMGYALKVFDTNSEYTRLLFPAAAGAALAGWTTQLLACTLNAVTTHPYPQQGTDINQRIGKVIRLKDLLIRFSMKVTPITGAGVIQYNTMPIVRVIFVYDKQVNGATPTADQIITTSGGLLITNFLNVNNKARFNLLYDNTFTFNVWGEVNNVDWQSYGTTQTNNLVKVSLPLKNKKVVFSGTGGTVTSMNTGAIHYLVLINDCACDLYFGYSSRLIYTDE